MDETLSKHGTAIALAIGAIVVLLLLRKSGSSGYAPLQPVPTDPNAAATQQASITAQAQGISDVASLLGLEYQTNAAQQAAAAQNESAVQIAQINASAAGDVARAETAALLQEAQLTAGTQRQAQSNTSTLGWLSFLGSFLNPFAQGAAKSIFGGSKQSGSGTGTYAMTPFGTLPMSANGLPNWYANVG